MPFGAKCSECTTPLSATRVADGSVCGSWMVGSMTRDPTVHIKCTQCHLTPGLDAKKRPVEIPMVNQYQWGGGNVYPGKFRKVGR
jgi:hypothetical protein